MTAYWKEHEKDDDVDDEREKKSDDGRVITWAGKAVGLTKDIRPAKQVVEELHRDAVRVLKNAASLL